MSPSGYPGSLDSLSTSNANATTSNNTHPALHNDANDAINKIEAELGIDPSGASATVKARLDGLVSGSAPMLVGALSAGTSVGATSVVLNQAPAPVVTGTTFVAIDPFTIQCEIRKVTGVSGATLTVAALAFAHASSDNVYFFQGDSVPVSWFGAPGDGSTGGSGTDAEPAIQAACLEAQREDLWVDLGGDHHLLNCPLILRPTQFIKHGKLVYGSYTANDAENAMVMQQQGTVLSFTAVASTDVFTTPSAHSLPADDVGIVFKGGSLPGGIVAGRLYFSRDRTATTFKVAAAVGGAAVNVTADGSGTVYCEVLSLQKAYLDDIQIVGRNVLRNGAEMYLQQNSWLRKFRVDSCTDAGLILGGQECEFYGLQFLDCPTGLALQGAKFMYFYGLNSEGANNTRAVHTRANPIYPSEFGATSCEFHGVHLEGSNANSVGFDFEAQALNIKMSGINCSFNLSTQKMVYCHTSGTYSTSGWQFDGAWFSAATPGAPTAVHDTDRGHTVLAWDGTGTQNFRRHLTSWSAPQGSVSDSYPERHPARMLRPGGGYLGWGGQRDNAESWVSRPGSSQTAPQSLWQTTGDVDATWINKGGYLFTALHAAPADADLAAGQLAFWFDQTNGASKLMVKAKQADGTVKTGQVALA